MSHHLKKPEFPKPRIIREGFIPERNIMKGYRIKKVTKGTDTRFYPQKRVFRFLWCNMFDLNEDSYSGFLYYDCAVTAILNDVHKKVSKKVEYLDVPYENQEPNPPPKNP